MDKLTQVENHLFLIVGCGRSGTTLLKTILNAHPEISIPHETFFFNGIAKAEMPFEEKLDMITGKWWIKSMGIKREQLKDNLDEREPSWRNLFLSLLASAAQGSPPKYYGEKTVANIRFAEQLLDDYPKCRVIQIIRDPRAAFSSFRSAKVGTNEVAPLIRDWKWAMGVDQKLREHPRYQSIRFESLITDPRTTMQQVSQFLDIPFSEEMMNFHERADKGFSAVQEHHENTTRPVFSTGLHKWKSALSQSQIGMIEHHLGNLMTSYGYELTGAKVGFPDLRLRCSWFFDALWRWCVARPRAQVKKFRALRALKNVSTG